MIIRRELTPGSLFILFKLFTMNTIKKLKEQLERTKDELYELHFAEPSPEMYMQRRSELEFKIVCLEERIELEKQMAPLKWMLYGFIVAAFGLLLWAFVASL